MHTDLENFWQRAENQFLNQAEIQDFRQTVNTLRQRLATYETLRDAEATIFQAVVTRLEAEFPDENPKLLERALKHWISITRYSAMAMLLNNPEYLQHRLLEWLTDIVKVYRLEQILRCLDEYYTNAAGQVIPPEGMSLLQPFLEQAKTTLFAQSTPIATVL